MPTVIHDVRQEFDVHARGERRVLSGNVQSGATAKGAS